MWPRVDVNEGCDGSLTEGKVNDIGRNNYRRAAEVPTQQCGMYGEEIGQ